MFSSSLRKPRLACVKHLIAAGAKVDAEEHQGATSLVFASQYGYVSGMRLLLKNNADINKATFIGETPLAVSIQVNGHASLHILLDHGAKLTLCTKNGRSILHEAAEYGDLKALQILTSTRIRSLQRNKKNNDGRTPLDLAKRRDEETPEWHAAFDDLLASVDETPLEPALSTAAQNTVSPTSTMLSRIRIMVMSQMYGEGQQICEYLGRIPRPPLAVIRTLAVLCMAITWALLRG